ncbi:LysM peptidoglycan-binding domain-containing protein [Arthrobacter sp. L77]|uniref:LysM peptidoglycan-binding domain-containing protein n=1 Tax=Arthrobacter sp. L77 TaxID=1496689 RepID=UPI0009E2A5E6|nr:LysM peptidoglycan-binding domain-containing protein [Arthrobacter sp. L77]
MSDKNTRGRHRATTSTLSTLSRGVSSHGGKVGRQVALVALGSGLVLSMATPAQAGAIANAPQGDSASGAASSHAGTSGQAVAFGPSTHTVVAGDTLNQIGALHGIALETILSLNGLQMDSTIYPGDVIALTGATNTQGVELMTAPAPTSPAPSADVPDQLSTIRLASADVEPEASSSTNGAILEAARAQMGAIQDCTVLGEVALRAAGIEGVGDESPESLMAYATPVSTPKPGDFIYYADGGMGFSHNAVYLGDGQAIHSGWNGNQTVVESVDVGSGPVYYRVNA